jgi:lysophospholipase L1-like esterase
MGVTCAEKSRELAQFYAPVAKAQGCAFLDAEGVAEFNKVDFMHLSRKGHAQLAEKLTQLVRELV